MRRFISGVISLALLGQIFGLPLMHTGTKTVYAAARINYLGVAGKSYIGSTPPNPPNLQNGLVGHWTFDGPDMIPNARDRGSGGNHGQLINFTATTTKVGMVGQALFFDGSNDVVRMGDVLDDVITATSTYCSWARPTGTTAQTGYIFGKFVNGIDNGWFFRRNGNSQWWFSTKSTDSSLTATLTLEVWQHMCVVYAPTPNTSYLYRDGVLVDTSTTLPTVTDVAGEVMIGDRAGSDRPFAGEIDDARLYNRALSAAEIAQIYKLGANSKQMQVTTTPPNLQTGLVGHWTFDGPDMIPNVRDKSGQGNNGTLNGSAATTTVPGIFGQAFKFNGSNQYVSTSVTSLSTSYSMSMWINTPNTSSNYGYFAQRGGGFGVVFQMDQSAGFARLNVGDSPYVVAVGAITPNKWTHIVGVRNGGSLIFYVNGVQTDSQSGVSQAVAPTSQVIGAYMVSGSAFGLFPGSIDDVRVYNRALSATEVLQLYKLGR